MNVILLEYFLDASTNRSACRTRYRSAGIGGRTSGRVHFLTVSTRAARLDNP